jgi:polar amino acid transport system substrate-binding protein
VGSTATDALSASRTNMRDLLHTRRTILGGLVGVSAVLVSGCESREPSANVAIVGSSPSGVPFSFIDPWTNELAGSMIDTVLAVAEQAMMSIELRVTPFSALLPSLLAHKIDVIAAAMLRTAEREKVVAFSEPVFSYSGGLVVADPNTARYPNLAALRHLRVGAQVGTRFVDQVTAAGIEHILTYDNLSDMLRDLRHGRIDAAYGDAPILAYQLRVGGRRGMRLVRDFEAPAQEDLCFVVRKLDPLLPRINEAIERLKPVQIPAIVRRWGLA